MPSPTFLRGAQVTAVVCLFITAAALGVSTPAAAQNLLTNPGFETCDFTGWTVGGSATSGVNVDDTPIIGTIIPSNVVNVRSGTCAAWAKVARSGGIHFDLEQTVNVAPDTDYEVSFWNGLGGTSNAGRYAVITVDGSVIFDGYHDGIIGTDPDDYVKVKAIYASGSTSGPVTVRFSLRGSGTGLAGLSYDDFSFAPAGNLLENPGFESCDFTGWTVGGSATSGVNVDDAPISGTVIGSNVVNVHSGNCAAWAKVARSGSIHFTLEQTVDVEPNTSYVVSFWNGLGGTGNAGRYAVITVDGSILFEGYYDGVIGTDPDDYVQVKAIYRSGPVAGPVTVEFSLQGSGTGLAGLSYDDFSFAPAKNLLRNPGFETCDFTDWTVGGSATSGVNVDDAPISGTVIPSNVVNVHSGTCAAWAKVARSGNIHFNLEQTVNVAPNTVYEVSFWNGLGGTSNAGRYAVITVDGSILFEGYYDGVIGTDPDDYVEVKATYVSGSDGGPVTVQFSLQGSGTGLAGLSYDDLSFIALYPAALLAVDEPTVPRSAQLGFARPNPFTLHSTIPFAVEREGVVRLDVYNVRGARVRALVDGYFTPGRYSARWDGADNSGRRMPGGVYFLHLVTPLGEDRGRLVLSR